MTVSDLAIVKPRTWRSSSLWRAPVRDKIAMAAFTLVVVAIVVAASFTPYSTTLPSGAPSTAPSLAHLAGTDAVGLDIFSRILVGARLSLIGAGVLIAIGVVFGGLVGVVAGFVGGWLDDLLMRFTDLFLAIPAPVLAIAVAGALGRSFGITLVSVAVVWWPYYARIVRGEARAVMARPHIEAARLLGRSKASVLFRHVLPGTIPPAVVAASLDVGNVILTLAALSFLGLSSPEPAPELGAMSAQGLTYLLSQWWVPVLPGAMVFVLVYLANIAGDSLHDAVGMVERT